VICLEIRELADKHANFSQTNYPNSHKCVSVVSLNLTL